MQDLAYRTLLEGLVRGGLLVGQVDDMMAADVGALFMPHGGQGRRMQGKG